MNIFFKKITEKRMGEALTKIDSKSGSLGLPEFQGMTDNSPINILYCDLDFNITYANNASLKTLEPLEQYMPIPISEIVGANIDIFHKNPAHQRKLLRNEKNLPHRANIALGPETLDLLVSGVYNDSGKYIGTMVTWDVITEALATQKNLAQVKSMVENAPTNIMYCDTDRVIQYLNPKSDATLRTIEQFLPVKVDDIVGGSIDVFHKSPELQANIVSDPKNLPHNAIIQVGPEKLDLLVSATFDQNGKFIGPMVTWEVVTKKLEDELEMQRIQEMVENMPVNVLTSDLEGNIQYVNKASRDTLETLEQHLPVKAKDVKGGSMDVFHKNPAHQRKIIGDAANLPYRSKIRVGPETLDLLISPIIDAKGTYLGPMLTWSVVSSRVKLIKDLSEASQKLAAASEELEASSQEISRNAESATKEAGSAAASSEEVARGVESVATNTEEMNAAIKEIARAANEASKMANQTLSQAHKTNQTISILGESSKEIGNVIKVISSIAQQTNLLALNATIEAARAGDAGRGFAVVANEVKELAKQTAQATEDITQKIGAIQSDTDQAVVAIEEISKSVEKVNDIAGSIAASVEEQQATTTELTRIVSESAQGVKSISESIKVVSDVSEQTSQGTEQNLSAVGSLKDLATSLTDLVKQVEV
jgi:methyl-accepting chemotaxis protein